PPSTDTNTIPIVVWSLWTALLSPTSWIGWYPTTSPPLGLHPTAPLSILGLRFASYTPLGSAGCLPVCGLCPLSPHHGLHQNLPPGPSPWSCPFTLLFTGPA